MDTTQNDTLLTSRPVTPPTIKQVSGVHWPKYRVIEDQVQHLFYIEKRVWFFFWSEVLRDNGKILLFYELHQAKRWIERDKESIKLTNRRIVFED